MKTPKGLKKHRESLKTLSLDLTKAVHMENWENIRKKYKTWAEMEKSKLYQGTELLNNLCGTIAKDITGYYHFSDVYDSGPEYVLKDLVKGGYYEDSEDDDSSSSGFDRYDYYEEIKDGFKNQVVSSFNSFDLKKSEAAEKFYKHCVKMKAFDGSFEDFSKSLKHNYDFINYLGNHIVRFRG